MLLQMMRANRNASVGLYRRMTFPRVSSLLTFSVLANALWNHRTPCQKTIHAGSAASRGVRQQGAEAINPRRKRSRGVRNPPEKDAGNDASVRSTSSDE